METHHEKTNGHHHSQHQRNNSSKPRLNEKSITSSGIIKPSSFHSSEYLRQLTDPPPTSMVLVACLRLLTAPLVPPHNIYLMTQAYLQNWLNWAYQQPLASANEKDRLKEVIRLAAIRHSLACPTPETQYSNPGPIDGNDLSMQGHPLLLRPDAAVLVQPAPPRTATKDAVDESTPSALRRARSLPNNNFRKNRGYLDAALSGANGGEAQFRTCAVPELFYEVSWPRRTVIVVFFFLLCLSDLKHFCFRAAFLYTFTTARHYDRSMVSFAKMDTLCPINQVTLV